MTDESPTTRAFYARERFWKSLGELDPDCLSPLMNPSLMGGPKWPDMRQAWRVIRKPTSTIIASDGLSDPFEGKDGSTGFKIELAAEAPLRLDTFEAVRSSWLFDMVFQASQLVAHHRNVYGLLQQYRTLSTVVNVGGVPGEYLNSSGKVGILVGFPTKELPAEIELVGGNVRLLVVKILHRRELEFIESHEHNMDKQRDILVEKFGDDHLSRIDWVSLV